MNGVFRPRIYLGQFGRELAAYENIRFGSGNIETAVGAALHERIVYRNAVVHRDLARRVAAYGETNGESSGVIDFGTIESFYYKIDIAHARLDLHVYLGAAVLIDPSTYL